MRCAGLLSIALLLALASSARAGGPFSPPDLLAASDSGDLTLAREAILHGDDPDIVAEDGQTPLIRAVRHGFSGIVKILIDGHAKLRHTDREGKSPLYWAADTGHDQLITTLLDAGAQVDQPARGGVTPLMAAAARGDQQCVQALLSAGANSRATDHTGRDPLDWAREGHNGAVEAILRQAQKG